MGHELSFIHLYADDEWLQLVWQRAVGVGLWWTMHVALLFSGIFPLPESKLTITNLAFYFLSISFSYFCPPRLIYLSTSGLDVAAASHLGVTGSRFGLQVASNQSDYGLQQHVVQENAV